MVNLNLFQGLFNEEMLKQVQHDSASIVCRYDTGVSAICFLITLPNRLMPSSILSSEEFE